MQVCSYANSAIIDLQNIEKICRSKYIETSGKIQGLHAKISALQWESQSAQNFRKTIQNYQNDLRITVDLLEKCANVAKQTSFDLTQELSGE